MSRYLILSGPRCSPYPICLFTLIVGAIALVGLWPVPARSVDAGMSFEGYTGLLTIPTGRVTPEGDVDVQANNYLDPRFRHLPDREARNYIFSVGMWPHLEVGGRLAEIHRKDADPYAYRDLDQRDLSGNIKLHLPTPYPREGLWPQIAVGMQDFAGLATNYRNRYTVATSEWQGVALTLGYGLGPDRLEGTFGGLVWEPLPGFQLQAERTPRGERAGGRLVWRDFLGGFDLAVKGTFWESQDQRTSLAATLTLPLTNRSHPVAPSEEPAGSGGSSLAPQGESRERTGGEPTALASQEPARPADSGADVSPSGSGGEAIKSGSAEATDESWQALAEAVRGRGLAPVRVGHADDTLVVRFGAARFNRSDLDGLGIALGETVRNAPSAYQRVVVWLERQDQLQLGIATSVPTYRRFLAGEIPPARMASAVRVLSPGEPSALDRAQWKSEAGPGKAPLRLFLRPDVRTLVGTEWGVLNYSLAAVAHVRAGLWPGGHLAASWKVPLDDTPVFEPGGSFEASRQEGGLDELLVQQVWHPFPGVTTLTSAGRYPYGGEDYHALFQEGAWQFGPDRAHQVRAHGAVLEPVDEGTQRDLALAGYRYLHGPWDTAAGVTGGRFLHGDEGFRFNLERSFGDTRFTFYYKWLPQRRLEQVGGLQVSFPLTPRKEPRFGPLVVGGTDRWSYYQETVTQSDTGQNELATATIGQEPTPYFNLRKDVLDANRLVPEYVKSHLPRLRQAYRVGRGPSEVPDFPRGLTEGRNP